MKDHDRAIMDGPQNTDDLFKLVDMKMPFGKYTGTALVDLPEPYVVWFHDKGFPPGELGRLLGLVYEIKANGLEYLFEPIKRMSKSL